MEKKLKNILLDIFFPKHCFGCQNEGCYLCQDCRSILGISGFHKKIKTDFLDDLYFAANYENALLKRLIKNFKYQPFVKELNFCLSCLITDHLQLLDETPLFIKNKSAFLMIPLPLEKKRLKWRGFNQAEEIAKTLSDFLKIPLLTSVLFKNKETLPQAFLSVLERKRNVSNVFSCKENTSLKGKKVLLIDDIYTTGSTMQEAARVLKNSGAKTVTGIVIARAKAGQDNI